MKESGMGKLGGGGGWVEFRKKISFAEKLARKTENEKAIDSLFFQFENR